MTIWFIAAAAVLIVELFTGTVYLLVVSAALFGAGLAARLTDSTGISIMTAAVLSALGIWLVHGRLKQRSRLRAIWTSGKAFKSCAICTAICTKCPTAARAGRHRLRSSPFRRPQPQ